MATETRDQVTFESLLTAVLPAAYRTALHFTRNQADAEDAVQQSSFLAWRAFDSFEEGSNFRAWFLRIVTNTCLSEYRRVKRAPAAVSIDEPEIGDAVIPAEVHAERGGDRPDAGLLARLDARQIAEALAELPEDYRVVATLYFVEDLSYQEIAEIVERPIGTVRSRLHRGRKLLQMRLWELAEERGLLRQRDDFSDDDPTEAAALVA